MIGSKVIARESSRKWGYVRGDTLEIIEKGCMSDVYVAKNITRPNYRGSNYALILESEFKAVKNYPRKVASNKGNRVVRIVKILGITVYKEVIVEGE